MSKKRRGDNEEVLEVPCPKDGKTEKEALAETALDPRVGNASSIRQFGKMRLDGLDLTALVAELKSQTDSVKRGDLSRAEDMLAAQAHTLDALFHKLIGLSMSNAGEGYLKAADSFMKFALRAQSQCRTTWEAVATIQNPPMLGIVKQANIAHGPQQVNNGSAQEQVGACAREKQKQQNQLLEKTDGQRLDTGEKGEAGGFDTPLEAVGAVNWPEDTQR